MVRDRFEGPLQQLAIERGLGVVPYFGLASGFLTGKYRTPDDFGKSVRGGGMKRYLDDRGLGVLQALDEVAAEADATPAQVALAWLAAQPGVTAPIASATSVAQLEELLSVFTLELSADQVERLNAASVETVAS
jgi:aryl-alcohol dehydrogenase-like predicted oxidoreductase